LNKSIICSPVELVIEVRNTEVDTNDAVYSAIPGEMVTDNKVTIKGLTKGKPYEFRVAAVNGVGVGEYAQTNETCRPPSSFSYISLSIL